MVAVVSVLPLKGGLLLPQKIVDQNRMESSGFFLLLLCADVFMLSFLPFLEERMGENPSP